VIVEKYVSVSYPKLEKNKRTNIVNWITM